MDKLNSNNNVYINFIRQYEEEEWYGATHECTTIDIPIKSLDFWKRIKDIDIKIENIKYEGLIVKLELEVLQFDYSDDLIMLKKIVNVNKAEIEKALNDIEIYEFDIVFDFYNAHMSTEMNEGGEADEYKYN